MTVMTDEEWLESEKKWLVIYFPVSVEEVLKLSIPALMAIKNLIGELQHYRDLHAAEERRAWDEYVAAWIPASLALETKDYTADERASRVADCLLEQRRKRFPVKP